MSDVHGFRHDAVLSHAADGSLVLVVHLSGQAEATDIEQLVTHARNLDARAIWVFGGSIDPTLGFTPATGCVRLEAPVPPAPILLPAPPFEVFASCRPPASPASGAATSLSRQTLRARMWGWLYEKGRWVGICQALVIAGWIDGPGVHPMLRTPERSVQLVRGAAAYLSRNRPVTLETWGESADTLEAYRALGFDVIEELPGWEFRL
jgi:hypothetical protein